MPSLKAKIEFYFSMASLTDAGIPLIKSLKQNHSHGMRKTAEKIAEYIQNGQGSLHEQMSKFPKVFSEFECRIIKIGEETGHLEKAFANLAEWARLQEQIISQLLAGLTYPFLLYHFAGLMLPLISFFSSSGKMTITELITRILIFILAPYFLCAFFFMVRFVIKKMNSERLMFLSVLLLYMPVLGKLFRKMDYTRFFRAYSLALNSGIPVFASVRLGAETCLNSQIKKIFINCAYQIEHESCPFSEAFEKHVFKEDKESIAVSLMHIGDISGTSDKTASRIADIFQAEADERIKILVNIIPKLIYIAIAIYLAAQKIKFWGGIFSQTFENL